MLYVFVGLLKIYFGASGKELDLMCRIGGRNHIDKNLKTAKLNLSELIMFLYVNRTLIHTINSAFFQYCCTSSNATPKLPATKMVRPDRCLGSAQSNSSVWVCSLPRCAILTPQPEWDYSLRQQPSDNYSGRSNFEPLHTCSEWNKLLHPCYVM